MAGEAPLLRLGAGLTSRHHGAARRHQVARRRCVDPAHLDDALGHLRAARVRQQDAAHRLREWTMGSGDTESLQDLAGMHCPRASFCEFLETACIVADGSNAVSDDVNTPLLVCEASKDALSNAVVGGEAAHVQVLDPLGCVSRSAGHYFGRRRAHLTAHLQAFLCLQGL